MTALNIQERLTDQSFAIDCCRQHLRVFYPGWREIQPAALRRLDPLMFFATNGLANAGERGISILIPQWELIQGDAATASAISRHFANVRKGANECADRSMP